MSGFWNERPSNLAGGDWVGCCAGAADLVAEAKKHLGAIPTEYDEDGLVPPIQDALLAVTDAKLVERL